MASSELRPIGTMVDHEETKDGRRFIYHYQVVAHTSGFDGKLTELLQLRATETQPKQSGPTIKK